MLGVLSRNSGYLSIYASHWTIFIGNTRQLCQQLAQNQVETAREDLTKPTPATHPNIKWWRKSAFDRWLEKPKVIEAGIERGPIPWLEQENGNPVDPEEATAIKATLRRGFAELVTRGWAPRSWGLLNASGRELIDSLVPSKHPVLKFDIDGWKLHHLATTIYPQWRAQHLDENLTWKKRNHIKSEEDEGSVKQKRKRDTEGSIKRMKRSKSRLHIYRVS